MFFVYCTVLIIASIAQAQDRDTLVTVRRGDSLLGIAERLLPYSHHYTAAELVGEIRRAHGVQGDAKSSSGCSKVFPGVSGVGKSCAAGSSASRSAGAGLQRESLSQSRKACSGDHWE